MKKLPRRCPSPIIYGCIALSVVSLIIQNKAGAFTELLVIAFWLMVIFIYLIITFTVLLNATPDFDDLVFYYECYLILFSAVRRCTSL
jgi:heme/copper-type cytochrome/quinol oxidase subunit 1